MTWTKLGDEYSDLSRDLTDAEYRTHGDALCWSNRRGLDLRIPKRDLRRFAESPDADTAVKGLLAKNWWEDLGDLWDIGLVRPEWQLEAAVIEHRRTLAAARKRRQRLHEAGDHSICTDRCPHVTRDGTRDPGRGGSGRDGGLDPKDQSIDAPTGNGQIVGSAQLAATTQGGSGGNGEVPPSTAADGSRLATPPQTRKRVHDGPANHGPDDQHDSIEVHRQSQATDRYAREAVRQAVLGLRAEGLSYRQIAAQAGCSAAYAHKIVHAAALAAS